MMKLASDSKYLKKFNSERDLAKHEIFNKIPLIPSGIAQIAQLLMRQSLDNIVEKMEEDKKQK
jgi:hypothetical protein